MTKVTPFLMFDQLEAAMEFYTATFPDSEIRDVSGAEMNPASRTAHPQSNQAEH